MGGVVHDSKRFVRVGAYLAVLCLLAGLGQACAPTKQDVAAAPPASAPAPPQAQAVAKPEPAPKPTCKPFEPRVARPELEPGFGQQGVDVMLCPDAQTLDGLIATRDKRPEPAPAPASSYQDPVEVRGGLAIYRQAIHRTARFAWVVPVLFTHTPGLSPAQLQWLDANPKAAQNAQEIWSSKGRRQWGLIQRMIRAHRRDKAYIRNVLLRDGYLFVEDEKVARQLFTRLTLRHLFDEDEIFLRRGDVVYRLQKKRRWRRWSYVHADGPQAGNKARLLIFDRVATTREALLEGHHGWDVSRLRPPLGLRAFEVSSVGEDLLRGQAHLDGEVSFEGAAFDVDGRRVLAVVVPQMEPGSQTMDRITLRRRNASYQAGIIQAGEQMVAERLRFDEPRTEKGQQDGVLRIMWRYAYYAGHNRFGFNGDGYLVFTHDGKPNVPQVCIDFVLDSAERWSGAWWKPRGQGRERTEGFLDFKKLLGNERQVRVLVGYAAKHPEQMKVWSYGEKERVPYMRQEQFYEQIEGWSSDVEAGDAVVIYGLRSDGRNHWHVFYIYDTDPLYGIPYLTIGNAGVAKVTVWHDTMRKAPRRSVTHRIRFNPTWLAQRRSEELPLGRASGSGAQQLDDGNIEATGDPVKNGQ